jgi:hypothetical protein
VTVTLADDDPTPLEHVTVNVFEPTANGFVLLVGVVVAVPLIVHVVPLGIDGSPLMRYEMFVVVDVVVELFAGEAIVTTGAT